MTCRYIFFDKSSQTKFKQITDNCSWMLLFYNDFCVNQAHFVRHIFFNKSSQTKFKQITDNCSWMLFLYNDFCVNQAHFVKSLVKSGFSTAGSYNNNYYTIG